jgi:hypothetical protein
MFTRADYIKALRENEYVKQAIEMTQTLMMEAAKQGECQVSVMVDADLADSLGVILDDNGLFHHVPCAFGQEPVRDEDGHVEIVVSL